MRSLRLACVGVMALTAAGCDLLLTEPAAPEAAVSVSFAVTDAQRVSATFDKVDRVYLLFVRPDSSRRDTILPLASRDGVARARLALRSDDRVQALGIFAQLRSGQTPLFQGERIIRVAIGEPVSVEIPISGIPVALRASRDAVVLPSVGDTTRLGTTLYFANGDTLAQNVGTWTSQNPQIVFVTAGGLAAARAVGETRLLASYGELRDTVDVRVNAGR